MFLKALEGNKSIELSLSKMKVSEEIDGIKSAAIILPPIVDTTILIQDNSKLENIDIFFLIDNSKFLSKSGLNRVRNIVNDITKLIPVSQQNNLRLAVFENERKAAVEIINDLSPSQLNAKLQSLRKSNSPPFLNRFLFHALRSIKKTKNDKKIIFLFSNGKDEERKNQGIFKHQLAYNKKDVFRQIKDLGYDLFLLPFLWK